MKGIAPLFVLFVVACAIPSVLSASGGEPGGPPSFPLPLDAYRDGHLSGIGEILIHRIRREPLNLVVTVLFVCAVVHTFLAGKFRSFAHRLSEKHRKKQSAQDWPFAYTGDVVPQVSFMAVLFHFLGEVEVIFGLWVFPLFWIVAFYYGVGASIGYLGSVNFTEPMFVVIIMTLAATRPIMQMAERMLKLFAAVGKGSSAAWWFSIMTVGPLLGSFITEPAAMTISALILGKQFYKRKPSPKFAYATIGLLFVNVSVGGTLSHFAAPPVLMVAGKWDWSLPFMIESFGWKAIVGILTANLLYFGLFRNEFRNMHPVVEKVKTRRPIDWDQREDPVPVPIILVHVLFMVWTVANAHYPVLFIAGFFCFLGFSQATAHHQNRIDLKPALLVGFFLSGLVIHGGLQGWWIAPILGGLGEVPLMLGSALLTAFNDNAAITYLSTLVPDLSESLKYAIVAGAVTGGGLTVIANAPNPAGQSILQKYFKNGVSPAWLAISAVFPTIVMGCAFMLLP